MLKELRNLVFGIGGYEKVKIDARFEEIVLILPNIKITQLSDFESLEECLYKLKEQLRVKSSNLNRVIKDTTNSLTKRRVDEIISALDKKKFDFLNSAFAVLNEIPVHEPTKEDVVAEISKKEEPKKVEKNIEVKNQIEVYEDSEVKVYLHNGKVMPYLLIDFKNEVNFPLLKYLSALVFEEITAQGTNIIIEKNMVLIVPRKVEDKLITMPRVKSDLDEIYNKLKKDGTKDDEKYVEIVSAKEEPIKTKKKQEDSLDSLLDGIEKKEVKAKPNPKEDKDEIKIERSDEKVEVEKKHNLKDEIEIIEKSKEEVSEIPFEIYRDEQIVAYFEKNSKVHGEIVIKLINNKKISDINESEISYMSIFSKVFASVLFETVNAQGTNIIWDNLGNSLRIIPRFQNDNVKVNWEPKHTQEEFLDQIKNRLLTEMKKEVSKDFVEEKIESKVNMESSDDSKKRAQYILDSLKRIP